MWRRYIGHFNVARGCTRLHHGIMPGGGILHVAMLDVLVWSSTRVDCHAVEVVKWFASCNRVARLCLIL